MIHYITPRGTQDAWVGNELQVLARAGIPFQLHALTRPKRSYFQTPEIRDLETRVLYPISPIGLLVSLGLAPWRFGRRFFAALANAAFGPRETLRVRLTGLWHFAVACHWARLLRNERVDHIHSQWIHSSGTVAMFGAWLLDAPFSFTGHGADVFRDRAALDDKIRRADFIVCISSFHRDLYLEHGARPEQLVIVYCGIDTEHFRVAPSQRSPTGPVRILSAGRLVAKKGFDVLIAACADLRSRGVDFGCEIAGSGELEADLRRQVELAGLGDCVEITGEPLDQEAIPEFMATGDVFCLPCVRAPDGDLDGLPQMLMEAMACGLPVVSTRLVGIPDLVVDEECGLLVESADPSAFADACERLIGDPALAAKLASAGRQRVVEHFDLRSCLEPLLKRFRSSVGRASRSTSRSAKPRE